MLSSCSMAVSRPSNMQTVSRHVAQLCLTRSILPVLKPKHKPTSYAICHAQVQLAEGSPNKLQSPPAHTPVLLQEVLQSFSEMQLKGLQHLVGIDLDPAAHVIAADKLQQFANDGLAIHPLQGNFGNMKVLLQQLPGDVMQDGISGMLLDLGISSMQVDQAHRGFSFSKDAPLDMRMGPSTAASAEQIVNTWSEAELGRIFREYGEERFWKGIAQRIVAARQEAQIRTTSELVRLIGGPRGGSKKGGAKQIHPATRVFQALRIAVNQELQMLEQALPDAIDCLAPSGRLAVISFHSLEDRIVKRAFLKAAGKAPVAGDAYGPLLHLQQDSSPALVRLVTKKPIVPGQEELRTNPRSRSAKLRVVEKL